MRHYLLVLLLMVIVAGLTYGLLLSNAPPLSKTEEEKNPTQQEGDYLAQIRQTTDISDLTLEKKSASFGLQQVILKRHYTYCGHTFAEKIQPGSPLLRLSRKDLLALYPGWKVEKEEGNSLTLVHTISDFCPEDLKKHYVGTKDGFVTIFYGEPEMTEKVFKVTDIPVEGLPLQVKEMLKKGIVSQSTDHLITIVEGIGVYYYE